MTRDPGEPAFAIGDVAFDRVEYDGVVDEVVFWKGPRRPIADIDETPEDHGVRFDAGGALVQCFIYAPRLLLERDGAIAVTLPDRPTVVLTPEQLAPVLVDPELAQRERAARRERWLWRLGLSGRLGRRRQLRRLRERTRPAP